MSGLDPGAGGGTPATYTFRTAGDELVCPICAPLNGNVYEVGEPGIPYPPLHRDCRCELEYSEGEPAEPDDYEGGGGDPSLQQEVPIYDPDDPDPGSDVELSTDPPTGVGPWEEDTAILPPDPKGKTWQ